MPALIARHSRITAAIALLLTVSSCSNKDPGEDPLSVFPTAITLTASQAAVEADGVSTVMINLSTTPVDSSGQLAVFSTTAGELVPILPGTSQSLVPIVTTNALGKATILLRAPRKPGTAVVAAAIGNSTQTVEITFTEAKPGFMSLETSSLTVASGFDSSVLVRAQLWRITGFVTPGTMVQFSAVRATGDSIGRFGLVTPTDENGIASVRFYPADPAYVGPILIKGSASNGVFAITSVNAIP